MEIKTVITLNQNEIHQAITEHLERKGYTALQFEGIHNEFEGIHNIEVQVKKIEK